MANLTETDIWADGIYQIEESDPVLGGADGIANKQAKQLAARTQHLKKLLGAAGVSVGQFNQLLEAVYTHTGLDKGEESFNQSWLMDSLLLLLKNYALKADVGDSIQIYATIPDTQKGAVIYVQGIGFMCWYGAEYIPDSQTWLDSAPVGFTMDWEGISLPSDKWLKYDGSTFDPARYPKLAALGRYKNNKLPDVSDRYVRYIGNRTDKYLQYHTMEDAIQNITGNFNHAVMHPNLSGASGAFKIGSNLQVNGCRGDGGGIIFITQSVNFNAEDVVRVSDETRPKTIMIRTKIVKAA